MSSPHAPTHDAGAERSAGSTCPACGGATVSAFEVGGFPIVRCVECSTLLAVGADEALHYYADERYFQNPDFATTNADLRGYKDYLADRAHIEQKFERVLEQIERMTPVGRLLDVGAGPGFLVSLARSRGWDARGVDLNPWAARYASEQLGVSVEVGSLEQEPPGSLEAITMLDLLEHVADPEKLVVRAATALKPGGVLVVLTPDAGSRVSRALGRRWPEIKRVPEHLVLFSAAGLSRLLARHDLHVVRSESVGKTSSVRILAADVSPIAPELGKVLTRLGDTRLGDLELTMNARTKICVYAVRGADESTASAVHEDLHVLGGASRFADWMFSLFRDDARGKVAEIGSGIGTFTALLLDAGAERVVAVEPDERCLRDLDRRFGADSRVEIIRAEFPTELVERNSFDFVLCQNVLEHIEDDFATVASMAALLKPGGMLGLLVPAGPRLEGRLDREYGHARRYTQDRLRTVVEVAGLEIEELHHFNALGVPGWILANRRRSGRVGGRMLKLYDALLPLWRPIEEALEPKIGLSLVVRARRPS
jgi:2-polyprenyl-3-methyl-5-hydroxy-6-metoxy-1,4-benzoquinol methylase